MKREVGRNDPCPCGSGKKFKKCCGSPKLSARNIQVVKNGPAPFLEKISELAQELPAQAPSSLAGRVENTFRTLSQKKD